jgi:hypothetical protein
MYNIIKLLVLVATLLGSLNTLYASEIVDAPKEPIPIIELGNHSGQIGSLSLDRAGQWLVSSSTDYIHTRLGRTHWTSGKNNSPPQGARTFGCAACCDLAGWKFGCSQRQYAI